MIRLYTKPGCPQCHATARALDKRSVAYECIDVTEDHAAYDHVLALGYLQVPVVETSTEHWGGFRPDKLHGLTPAST